MRIYGEVKGLARVVAIDHAINDLLNREYWHAMIVKIRIGMQNSRPLTLMGGTTTVPAPRPVPDEVANMSPIQRMVLAVEQATSQVPAELQEKFKQIVANLDIIVGIGVLFVAAQDTPIGWIADAIGITWIGVDASLALADLVVAIADARSAVNRADQCCSFAPYAKDFIELAQNAVFAGAGKGLKRFKGEQVERRERRIKRKEC